jgi:hypothetical protein
MMKTIFCLLIPVIFFSCVNGDDPPSNIIQPEEMKAVLWDVIRAQSLAHETARKDSMVNEAIKTKELSQKVFQIYNIDSAYFNKSYNWYISHPPVLKLIFDSLYSQKQEENMLRLRKPTIRDSAR